jgi:hypothetical protein
MIIYSIHVGYAIDRNRAERVGHGPFEITGLICPGILARGQGEWRMAVKGVADDGPVAGPAEDATL